MEKSLKTNYWLLLLSVWLGSCIYLFHAIYADTRQKTIDELNQRQMIHAEQAAQSIESFFDHWITYLTSLSESEHIIAMDDKGKEEIELIHRTNLRQISAVSRVDREGTIIHTAPFNQKIIGMNVSHQKHVKEIMKSHKPAVSDLFKSVQGYDAVAIHVPVFHEKSYCGTLAVLVNVQAISKKILENIHIGKSGYAWLTSREGLELYCPIPGHTGRSVYETYKSFPTVIKMVDRMVKGEKGVTSYSFDQTQDHKTAFTIKQAVYMPIRVGNTFWSVVVASSEDEVMSGIASFGKKLLAVILVLFTGSLIFIYYGMKARQIIREGALRSNSEKTARALLNIPNAAAFLIDRNGICLDVNETMASRFKLAVSELVGRCIWDLFPPEVTIKRKAHFEEIVRDKRQVRYEDEREGIWNESIITPILDSHGQVSKVAILGFDITERKRAEKESENRQQQLLQAQKMEAIGHLAGGVAHDFNNMLGVIIGHVELLLAQVDITDQHSQGLRAIQKAAQRSADLTRQLLAFARQQTVAPKAIDLNNVVEEMLSMLKRLIGENIELVWIPDKNIGKVMIDPAQIDQIMVNLCINARDAVQEMERESILSIHEMGKITIKTHSTILDKACCVTHPDNASFQADPDYGYRSDHAKALPGSYVMLSVSDNGCGMDKETLSRIFDPFFTTKAVKNGTGLGLSSVYGSVRQNNGFINVYSEPGEGTTFRIYMPLHEDSYGSSFDKERESDHRDAIKGVLGSGQEIDNVDTTNSLKTILLVEDEEWLLELGDTMLKRLGYTVLTAALPREAINLVKTYAGEIDLLITDVIMPEMNGQELVRQLIAINPVLKYIFMSGYTADVIAHHGVLEEGVHFIQKPFSIQELSAKIGEVLNKKD